MVRNDSHEINKISTAYIFFQCKPTLKIFEKLIFEIPNFAQLSIHRPILFKEYDNYLTIKRVRKKPCHEKIMRIFLIDVRFIQIYNRIRFFYHPQCHIFN